MRSEYLPQILIALIVVVAVIVGLVVVGGPTAGRMEKRDEARITDLRELASFVECVADSNQNTLPEKLGQIESCSRDVRLSDPFTDVPYRYEPISPTAFRVCAELERPGAATQTSWHNWEFEPSTGCLTASYLR
jgi:hypothetical protein